jgi:hypothetical protein|tara:strand:+ start:4853 stop:5302 length:450 start_codon:yes stop_codon:yes gene_type:complete
MSFGTNPQGPTFSGEALNSNARGASRFPLSESPYGLPIAIGTAATLIHSCSASSMEEVYLWAHDYGAVSANIHISVTFDGTGFGATDTVIAPLTKQNGLYLVYPGIPHRTCEVYARASLGSSVNLVGFVMRHYPEDVNNPSAGYNGTGS